LYKLHGSINWVETKNHNSFFDIEEIYLKSGEQELKETCLIYPTPLKEGKSLTSPYTDLIREFQKSYHFQIVFFLSSDIVLVMSI
ncbi:hypothetical protein OLR56_09310, partial [Campylobacter jejuni]|nr:hypothetical protein [Campylobacter jejuni]